MKNMKAGSHTDKQLVENKSDKMETEQDRILIVQFQLE